MASPPVPDPIDGKTQVTKRRHILIFRGMIARFLSALSFLLFVPAIASAAPADCKVKPQDLMISSDGRIDRDKLPVDRSKSWDQLTRLHGGQVSKTSARRTIGMYTRSIRFEVASDFRAEGNCLQLQSPKVTLTYKDQKILVASELKPNGCQWRETLAHELRHHDLEEKLLPGALARLKQAIEGTRFGRPMGRLSAQATADLLLKDLVKVAQAEMKTLEARESQEHRRLIDTQEDEANFARTCAEEIKSARPTS